MAKPIVALMEKEMTRREFMATLALATGSVMGFSTIIHLLTGKSLNRHLGGGGLRGYGNTPYGGGREK